MSQKRQSSVSLAVCPPTDAVPLRVYDYARTPVEALHSIAWGGALVLLAAVLFLAISARVLSNRQQKRIA